MLCYVLFKSYGDLRVFINLAPDSAPLEKETLKVLNTFVDKTDIPSNTKIVVNYDQVVATTTKN
jgi:hypothetical protein